MLNYIFVAHRRAAIQATDDAARYQRCARARRSKEASAVLAAAGHNNKASPSRKRSSLVLIADGR
jgi:hypothetical protein